MESSERDKTLHEAGTAYVAKAAAQDKLETNAADQANIKQVIRQLGELPPAALQEVADFIAFLYQKHVRLAVDGRTARRQANRWLLDNVGNLVMASRPMLTCAGDRQVWRLAAFVTSPNQQPFGPIGYLDVDTATGQVLADAQAAEELMQRGQRLERAPLPAGN